MKNINFSLITKLTILLLIIVLSVDATPLKDKGFNGFNVNMILKYLKNMPPALRHVRQVPANPRRNDTVVIAAKAIPPRSGVDQIDDIDSVILNYTLDGNEWFEVNMDRSGDDNEWSGAIPATGTCSEVDYNITVKDTEGNITKEIPEWQALPGYEQALKDGKAKNKYDFLTKVYDHVNSQKYDIPPEMQMPVIPDYLDIRTLWFGYDESNLYFRIQYGGPVYAGTVQPVDLNAYLIVLINGTLDSTEGAKNGRNKLKANNQITSGLAEHFWVWYYAPPVEIIPPTNNMGRIPGIGLLHFNPNSLKKPVIDTDGFSYSIHDSFMDVSLSRVFIGPSENNSLTFVAGNFKVYGGDLKNIRQQMGDISYATTIIMDDHGYMTCPGLEYE